MTEKEAALKTALLELESAYLSLAQAHNNRADLIRFKMAIMRKTYGSLLGKTRATVQEAAEMNLREALTWNYLEESRQRLDEAHVAVEQLVLAWDRTPDGEAVEGPAEPGDPPPALWRGFCNVHNDCDETCQERFGR